MADLIKRYQKDTLEVIWQPSKCTHSGVCARSLGHVFNPKRRPWIDLDASDKQSIVRTVQSCPSGALSLAGDGAPAKKQDKPSTEAAGVSAKIIENGPMLVKGEMVITLADGTQQTKQNPALCRCGASANKPFCDGSHNKTGFKG